MSPASDQKRLSIDSQSSEGSASSHAHVSIHDLLTPPRSRKSTPATSVDSTSQHGDSKPSSRASFAEFASSTLDQSSSQVDQEISYAVAEIDGDKFSYLKVPSSLVPTGWSNDLRHLRIFPKLFDASDYALQGPILVALASNSDRETSQYMISSFGKTYIWTPSCDELLYVTELYSLNKILRRMDEGLRLRTKALKPIAQHSPPDQYLCHSLWFWEVPEGWSQSICDLEYLQDIMLGCYEYGLPLSVPILVSDGRSGSTEFFLKSGERYYLYYEISSDLVRIDKPTSLREILRVLGSEKYVGLKTTQVNVLPEYCGPNVVADGDVPEGWTNKINDRLYCGEAFYEQGMYGAHILLFQDGSSDRSPLYLVEAHREKHYIWDPASDTISCVESTEGLQDVLDILKDPSRQLSLSEIEAC